MKNVILFLFAIVAFATTSCKKQDPTPQEQYRWTPMPVEQVCNINSAEVQILKRKGYTLEEAYQFITPDGVAEIVVTKSENYPMVSSLIMHKNHIILMERELKGDGTFDVQLTDLTQDTVFFTGNLPIAPEEGQKKPCKDRTTTFNGCAKCFIEVIGNHWIGIGIGLLVPEAVVAGIIIHCVDHIGN